MDDTDPRLLLVQAARDAGRYDEAAQGLLALTDGSDEGIASSRALRFIAMVEWRLLLDADPSAGAVLALARDRQVARVLAGEPNDGAPDDKAFGQRFSRFGLVIDMNELLDDPRSTHAVFVQLLDAQPDLAARHAWRALPAIVAMGDFALGDRYRCDPLAHLERVNEQAQTQPLFPPPGQAPRVAAELTNLMRDARLAGAILRGLGRSAEADALAAAVLDGLAPEEVRALARRELLEPGTITGEIVARQMAHDAAAGH